MVNFPAYDVLGIGNAIVDVLSKSDDVFLNTHHLTKGTMTLINASIADRLYNAMGPGIECSGGSAANTIAGIASLGGKAAFVGKVHDDDLGRVFCHDIKALGIDFATPPSHEGPPTARCFVLVTPDAQRTMQTYLGACMDLKPNDIDIEQIHKANIIYLEGYLWDPPQAKEAFIKAATEAHRANRRVALSLSDVLCVNRHRDSFMDLLKYHVDVLLANEEEIKSLYNVNTLDEAMYLLPGHVDIAALTRGDKGCVVIDHGTVHIWDAECPGDVVDTTGAGDAFAAGFLFGLAKNKNLATSARIANICAAEIISHFGARSISSLKDLVHQHINL